jgi:transposase
MCFILFAGVWGPAGMTAPLSHDLRRRVVRAITGGLSRRAAAAKFDVSVASAVRWYQRFQRQGDVRPAPMGGDRTSHRIEAHGAKIMGWIEAEKDITIKEIRAKLAEEGHAFSHGAVWRLLDRHGYTVKKRPRMPANSTGRM